MEGRRVGMTRALTVSSDHSPLWRTFPEYLMNNISFYSQALSSGEQTNNLNRSTVCNLTWSHFIFVFSFKISTSSAPTTRCLTSSTWSAQTGSRSTVTRSWRWVSRHQPREYYFNSENTSCILCLTIFTISPLFWTIGNWNGFFFFYELFCGVLILIIQKYLNSLTQCWGKKTDCRFRQMHHWGLMKSRKFNISHNLNIQYIIWLTSQYLISIFWMSCYFRVRVI